MDGCKLFRRDRRGMRGRGVALYVRDCFNSLCCIADALVERGSSCEWTDSMQFLPVLEGLVGCILTPVTDKLGIIILLYLYIVQICDRFPDFLNDQIGSAKSVKESTKFSFRGGT